MSTQGGSSLERFITTRGQQMLGQSALKRSTTVQITIGAALTTLGIGFICTPILGGEPGPGVAAGAVGPLVGGVINLATGMYNRRRFMIDKSAPVQLTPEAKGLLMALHKQVYGWRSPWAWQGPHSGIGVAGPSPFSLDSPFGLIRSARRARRFVRWNGITPDMVPENLEEADIKGLERAAYQYNRIAGVIASGASGSAMLLKMAPRVSKAADEVMADALHQQAMIAKYPEGASAARIRLDAHVDALAELAERVETLAGEQPNLTDKVAYRASIDDVLDELRLEQLARSELRTPVDADRHQTNR